MIRQIFLGTIRAGFPGDFFYLRSLIVAAFHEEPPAGSQQGRGMPEDVADGVEPVGAAVQGGPRLMMDLRGQGMEPFLVTFDPDAPDREAESVRLTAACTAAEVQVTFRSQSQKYASGTYDTFTAKRIFGR